MNTNIPKQQIDQAYAHCQAMARSHYENFPVASWVLPRRIRRPVTAIYAFARTADDYADEAVIPGETVLDVTTRYARLDAMAAKLDMIGRGEIPDDPVFIALADSIERFKLPMPLFHDLLSAFRQDVEKKRYADFGEVMDYCRRSANPVGRLLLHLFGAASERNLALSDGVCSALQLINFMQDISQDALENDRIYLPEDEMKAFGVTVGQLRERRNSLQLGFLVDQQLNRAEKLLRAGCPLGVILKGRIGLELRLICEGGMAILHKLRQRQNAFDRPRLSRRDGLGILRRALFPRRRQR